jgi:hypothetical protein
MTESPEGRDRWERGDLCILDGQLVQFAFWGASFHTEMWTPYVWQQDGRLESTDPECLESADVLTVMAYLEEKPFVWWRRIPRRSKFLVKHLMSEAVYSMGRVVLNAVIIATGSTMDQ